MTTLNVYSPATRAALCWTSISSIKTHTVIGTHGMTICDKVTHGMTMCDIITHGMTICDIATYGMTMCGIVTHGIHDYSCY